MNRLELISRINRLVSSHCGRTPFCVICRALIAVQTKELTPRTDARGGFRVEAYADSVRSLLVLEPLIPQPCLITDCKEPKHGVGHLCARHMADLTRLTA